MNTSELLYKFEFLIKGLSFVKIPPSYPVSLSVYCNNTNYEFPKIVGPKFKINEKLFIKTIETDTLIEIKLGKDNSSGAPFCDSKLVISDLEEDNDLEIELKNFEGIVGHLQIRFKWLVKPIVSEIENQRTLHLHKIMYKKDSYFINAIENIYFELIIGTRSLRITDRFEINTSQTFLIFKQVAIQLHKDESFHLNCYIKSQSSFFRDIEIFSVRVDLKNKLVDKVQIQPLKDKNSKAVGVLAFQLAYIEAEKNSKELFNSKQSKIKLGLPSIRETYEDIQKGSSATLHNIGKSVFSKPQNPANNPIKSKTSISLTNLKEEEEDKSDEKTNTQRELEEKLKYQ